MKRHLLDRLAAPSTGSLFASILPSQEHTSDLVGSKNSLLLGRKTRRAITVLRAVRAELGVVAVGDDDFARALAEVSPVVGGGLAIQHPSESPVMLSTVTPSSERSAVE